MCVCTVAMVSGAVCVCVYSGNGERGCVCVCTVAMVSGAVCVCVYSGNGERGCVCVQWQW